MQKADGPICRTPKAGVLSTELHHMTGQHLESVPTALSASGFALGEYSGNKGTKALENPVRSHLMTQEKALE
jgi:hypothetical protein